MNTSMRIFRFLSTLLILAIVFSPTPSKGQTWEKQIYDLSVDGAYAQKELLHTQDRGFLVGGAIDTIGSIEEYISPFIIKLDSLGEKEWEFYLFQHTPLPPGTETSWRLHDALVERDSDFVLLNYVEPTTPEKPDTAILTIMSKGGEPLSIHRFSAGMIHVYETSILFDTLIVAIGLDTIQGALGVEITAFNLAGIPLWTHQMPDLGYGNSIPNAGIFQQKKILLVSPTNQPGSGKTFVFDLDGNLLAENQFSMGHSFVLSLFPEDGPVFLGHTLAFGSLPNLELKPEIATLNYWGSLNTFMPHDTAQYLSGANQIAPAPDGGLLYVGKTTSQFPGFMEISPTGQVERIVEHYPLNGGYTSFPHAVGVPREGVLLSYFKGNILNVVMYGGFGNDSYSLIEGNVFKDWNDNCLQDTLEAGFKQFLIQIDTADYSAPPQYALTNDSGYFSLAVDTGAYLVQAFYPYSIWGACQPIQSVYFPEYNDTAFVEFAQRVQIECPMLEVDLGTPFLRLCDTAFYSVYFSNMGTSTAEDAYIQITLDPGLTYIGASIPLTAQNGDTLLFDLGDVPPDSSGTFSVGVFVDCNNEMGLLHCTTAHIFPDTICRPAFPSWSEVYIEVTARCEGDSIIFTIFNLSDTDMTSDLNYFVVEDQIILDIGVFNLQAQDSMSVSVYAGGNTVSIFAQPPPDFPFNSFPGVTVSGCGDMASEVWFGYEPAFPENDASPAISIDCQPNVASFDPNDKTGFPLGLDPDGTIERNMDLEYRIRFQNTGTDTAFLVVIRDTLPAHLDPSTLRIGAASHPFTWELTGEGYLSFTFEDIMLPDSNVNEPASHGFVKFRIQQKPDLPLGTIIQNRAGIYFDFNAPIITNATQHIIGEIFVEIISFTPEKPSTRLQLSAYPNPFQEQVAINIEGLDIQQGKLQVFDAQGRLYLENPFSGRQVVISRADLPPGLYFFRILDAGELVGTGKLVKE